MGDAVISEVGRQVGTRVLDTAVSKLKSGGKFLNDIRKKGVEGYVTDYCILEVTKAVAGDDIAQYTPVLSRLLKGMSQMPKTTGDPVKDRENWIAFVDKLVGGFEADLGKEIHEVFSESFINNAETVLGLDGNLFRTREAMMEMLYSSPQFRGIPERLLSKVAGDFQDHSITVTDRFQYYLPAFLANLGANPAVSFIGNIDISPPLNLKTLNVVGFALYDKKQNVPREKLTTNPMEQFNERPKGTDQFGNEYHYNYFGPNNPLPNGNPINELDKVAMRHDYDYKRYGYNTTGAKKADKRMVDTIKMLIDNGTIYEDSPHDQLSLAKKAMSYFSLVDVK